MRAASNACSVGGTSRLVAALGAQRDELLDEQRVPFGDLEDATERLLVDTAGERGGVPVCERLERQHEGIRSQHRNNTTSFVFDLPFGRGRSFAGNASPALNLVIGGWHIAGANIIYAGEPFTLVYSPTAAFQVSGIQQDFRGANNYRPNVTGDVLVPSDQRTVLNWLNRDAVVIPTDPSQPFGNAPRNGWRGPAVWQVDMGMFKRFTLPWLTSNVEFRRSSSICSTGPTSRTIWQQHQSQPGVVRHDHADLRSAHHPVRAQFNY